MEGDKWMNARELYKKGIKITTIAKMINIDRKTARKLAKAETRPTYTLTKPKPSKLDKFKPKIDILLQEANYTAERIYEIILEQGFTGKIGIVKNYVRTIKKRHIEKATIIFETVPGQQAQMDWGSFGTFKDIDNKVKKLYCFCLILGYSRMRYIEFTTDMKTETLIQSHINAFNYFGGYTNDILYDNMKQVVIKRLMKQKNSKLNPLFEDFIGFHGIKPILCRPYRPQTKGKIERTVKYVKSSFWPGRKFSSIDNLNDQAIKWCEKVNNKVHGTTNEIPYERLKEENLNKINKIYTIPNKIIRKVEKTGTVNYQNNKYSVPVEYVGKTVEIENKAGIVRFKYKSKFIAEHKKFENKHNRSIYKEHYEDLLKKSRFNEYKNTLFKKEQKECVLSLDVENHDLLKYDDFC